MNSGRHAKSADVITLWTLVKDDETIVAFIRPMADDGVELLSTLNGQLFYSRVFSDRRRFLKAANSIRTMMGDQGWRAAEPDETKNADAGLSASCAPASAELRG